MIPYAHDIDGNKRMQVYIRERLRYEESHVVVRNVAGIKSSVVGTAILS